MQNKRLKNTIVIKGMASNIVDEAIVILKPNIKLKQKEFIDKSKQIERSRKVNNYIVNEAENVILNYMEKIKSKKEKDRYMKKLRKYKFLQISNVILIILIIALLIIK